jgi:sterol desaturase/sphingolipid hydroxylase (fatty acid hydroxylase superfamily)
MRADKRFPDEFGTELPPPIPGWRDWFEQPWTVERVVEIVLDNLALFTLYTALLGLGAVIGRDFPSACWWFLGASGVAFVFVAVVFGLVLVANLADYSEDDGNYPGS